MEEHHGIRISLGDITRAVFRLLVSVVCILAAYTFNRITGDLDKVGVKLTEQSKDLAEQSKQIAVIQATTSSTERIVEESRRELKDHAGRISKVENRCCKP